MPSVVLPFKKETENTYQYQLPRDERDGVCVSTVYVRKDAIEGIPFQIRVTVERV